MTNEVSIQYQESLPTFSDYAKEINELSHLTYTRIGVWSITNSACRSFYGSLAHEDKKILAANRETKLQFYIKVRTVRIKISRSKIHGGLGEGSVYTNLIRYCKNDYNDIYNALQIVYGNNKVD